MSIIIEFNNNGPDVPGKQLQVQVATLSVLALWHTTPGQLAFVVVNFVNAIVVVGTVVAGTAVVAIVVAAVGVPVNKNCTWTFIFRF